MLEALTHRWPLKLLALAIAVAAWLFVAVGERTQLAVAAPVEYVGLPADAVLVPDARDRIELQLQVSRWAARRVSPEAVRVRINVAQLPAGESQIAVTPSHVVIPPGVRVTGIHPRMLRVAVLPAAEKTLAVAPRLRGQPADGYAVGRVLVQPVSVQVKGPRSTIEARDTVETAPIDLTGSQATVTQTVGLVLPEYVYPTSGGTVQVTVEIRPEGVMSRRGAQP